MISPRERSTPATGLSCSNLTRRDFQRLCAGGVAALCFGGSARGEEPPSDFQLRYILSSSMYGCLDLEVILGEVKKTGAAAIDIWPRVHGNQREQIEAMGEDRFAELLQQYGVKLGCLTQYKLGPFALQEEMRFARRFGCRLIVTGARGPKGLQGQELKAAVGDFIEKMKPHLEVAEATGVTIAIENHANNLMESADGMKWLAEMRPTKKLAVAFAPYHLPQKEALQADLIRTLGDAIEMFYAWEHGKGCHEKLPKEQELMQMPGRGSLDFVPLLAALREIDYRGFTSIFMHPVPRGIPILETAEEVTAEINRARNYLNHCLKQLDQEGK